MDECRLGNRWTCPILRGYKRAMARRETTLPRADGAADDAVADAADVSQDPRVNVNLVAPGPGCGTPCSG
jgi:hypothetical protein